MRHHAIVAPQFWTGRTGKAIREAGRDAQVVALYLVTCPSSTMIGLYYLPLPTLSHEVGIPLQGALKALRRLSDAGFAYYDDDGEHVWVPEMARFQIGESLKPTDNRVPAVVRALRAARSCRFAADFYAKYRDRFSLPPLDDITSSPSPSEAPSAPLRSQEQEQGKQDQGHQQKKRSTASLPLGATEAYDDDDFNRFWSIYPRKTGKKKAFAAWRKLQPRNGLVETIADAVKAQAQSDDWRRDRGRFIPYPATWLDGRRWEDELPPATGMAGMSEREARNVAVLQEFAKGGQA